MKRIERKSYLDWLIRWKDRQIISINFEDLSYVELTEAEKLYNHIIGRLCKSGRNYVFLDEIQHVRNFE